jgi:hypothetical protein
MTPSNQPSLADLTNQMKQLAQSLAQSGGSGGKDLRLSETAHQNYINLIKEYRTALAEQYNKAASLADYGHPGQFASALHTRSNLINDVHGPDGALARLKNYMDYLDEFENTVNAAFKKMQAEDQGG